MKHIRPLAAAVALTIAAVTAGFAQAEPKKEAPNYYVLGASAQQASLMSTSVEHNGDVAEAWVLGYLPTAQTDTDGTQFQALWFLTDFNCKTNAATIKQIDVISPQGKKLASIPGNDRVMKLEKGSAGYIALQIACARDYPATVVTAAQATAGLKKYEAIMKAELEKAKGADQGESEGPIPQH